MDNLIQLAINDPSVVGEARRLARRQAELLAMNEQRVGSVAIVVSELATNHVKHAGQGDIILITDEKAGRLDIIASDKGPGMANVALCMKDGYSTAQTAGNGLGAISRLADEFDIFSVRGEGTIVCATFWTRVPEQKQERRWAFLNFPYPGETISGDACAFLDTPHYALAIVADGLGHGPEANIASQRAIDVAMAPGNKLLTTILEDIHHALHGTRGAAVALARIDYEKEILEYAAIGNISSQIVDQNSVRSLYSKDGIVGQNARKFESTSYPWSKDSILLMHSDGLTTRTKLDDDRLPGLRRKSPQIIATALMNSFRRGRDDATILISSPRLHSEVPPA